MISSSGGFDNNANHANPSDPNDKRQREYTRDNATKPIGEGGYYGGHDTITAEGMLLKKEVHKGDKAFEDFSGQALPWFRIGAHDEDSTKIINGTIPMPDYERPIGPNGDGNYFDHFYNPTTEKGLSIGGVPIPRTHSATERAMYYLKEIVQKTGCGPNAIKNLSPTDRQKVYDYFGRIEHLINDMGGPSHTKNDVHIEEPFEKYVNDHWNEIVNSDAFKNNVTVDSYLNGNYGLNNNIDPTDYMKALANKSREYYSQEELYDYSIDPNTGNIIKEVNMERLMKNVNDLVPETIKYAAGFIDAVYQYMSRTDPEGLDPIILKICKRPPDPPSPSNDHPDDRFDVSDEFYWEKEFGLTVTDLIELYLRTAVKKGKIGVWYGKRFREIFIDGRIKYKEATQETKDAIEEEFQSVKKKLVQRGDQIEDDWKGAPDIALFANGFYNPSISLMLKIEEPLSFQDINFNPGIIKNHPVLLVPTGGFYGLKNSVTVKSLLDEYVKNGGTLVVLSQQHAYDWELLPTPVYPETNERRPVTGYGYQEDQSCQFNSVYIDTYHPILSVFSTSTANIGVDGYFASYPENSTILLRRVSNGQPAMIMYPYGSGYVIATTIYTDFAFSHSQANQIEVNFLQNIISWAKKPADLPEIKPGEVIDLILDLTNFVDINAVSAKFAILDPAKKIINEQTQNLAISTGQTIKFPFSYTTPTNSALGIYHIDYTLYDSSGNIIQPQAETDSGRFVVSNPPAAGYQSREITFSVESDSEWYIYKTDATFTINIWNNTDVERIITAKYDGQSNAITILPKNMGSIQYSKTVWVSGWHRDGLFVSFYDESGKYLGSSVKGYMGILPDALVTVTTDKPLYARGETVRVQASLQNKTVARWQPDVKISIDSPGGGTVFSEKKSMDLSPSGSGSVASSFITTTNLPVGTYVIFVSVEWKGWTTTAWGIGKFELPQSQISTTPVLTNSYSSNMTIPFVVNNTGKINVSSGILDVSFRAPGGNIVYSGNQPFSLAVGETKALPIPISIPTLEFGEYTLTYSQSDETRQGKPITVSILNQGTLDISLDKPTYKIGETANVTLSMKNTGKFKQEGTLTIEVPSVGFTDTKMLMVNATEAVDVPFSLPLPLTLQGGGIIRATFTLSPSQISKQILLNIDPLNIKQNILFDKISYKIRENLGLNYVITNNGKFILPLDVSFSLSIPDLNYTNTGSLTLEPGMGSETPLTIPIPETISAGQHQGSVALTLPSGVTDQYDFSFTVPESLLEVTYAGPPAAQAGDTISLTIENTGGVDTAYGTESLSVKDKQGFEIYRASSAGPVSAGEKKTLDIQIPSQVTGGEVYLSLQMRDTRTGKSVSFNKSIQIAGLSAVLDAMTDKNAYLNTESVSGLSNVTSGSFGIDSGNLDILVSRVGGIGPTQFKHFLPKKGWKPFNNPRGIAVNNFDFSLYIVDTGNHRIQQYSKEGNFISEWGSYGVGDGQFNSPSGMAIAHDGLLYVADTWNHRIQKFDSDGNFIAKWGSHGSGDGQFDSPSGIASGPDGFIYVLDTNNNRVQKFDSNGVFQTKWGSEGYEPGQFLSPSAIAVVYDWDYNNTFVYVGDAYQVHKFDTNGNFILSWSSFPVQGIAAGPAGMGPIPTGPDYAIYVIETPNWNGNTVSGIVKYDGNGNLISELPYWTSLVYTAIAIDLNGFIYVAESSWNAILVIDNERYYNADSGEIVDIWKGGAGRSDGLFSWPQGVSIGPDGSIYVADTENNRIQKFDSSGRFVKKWGSYGDGSGEFKWPGGIATGPDGFIFVADSANNCIQKFDSNGNFIAKWGTYGYTEGQFNYPSGIALGPDGSVYVADTGNHRIQKFRSDGTFIKEWGSYGDQNGQFDYPESIAVGLDGSAYVADTWNNRIQKFDGDGNFIMKWGDETGSEGQLMSPMGVSVSADGYVYVLNFVYTEIKKFDTSGNFVTKWGDWGDGDGQFFSIQGIAIGADGTVYVADTGNHRVQRMLGENALQTIFETTVPVTQPANATRQYATAIGTLNASGKFHLEAILTNSLGQRIADSVYPFYIIEGNTVLSFNTDKKIYKPGEVVTISGEVKNLASVDASNMVLSIKSAFGAQSPQLLHTENLNIPAGGSQAFTVTTTAGSEGIVTLTGSISQNNSHVVEIADQYGVAKPNVSVAMTVPDIVESKPFFINLEIKNTGKVEATVQFEIESSEFRDSRTIVISAGETNLIQYQQQISHDTDYTFTFAGDLDQRIDKKILFGEKAKIQLVVQSLYQEGDITISYILSNTGFLGGDYPVTFILLKDGQEISRKTNTFTLPASGRISSTQEYRLTEGRYTLTYQTTGFESFSEINVTKSGQGNISLIMSETYPEGMVTVPYTVTNTGPFGGEFTFQFELGTFIITKTAFLSAGEDYSGTLQYTLSLGSYTINAVIVSYPNSRVSKRFQVLRKNNVVIGVSLAPQTNGLIPVTVNLTNQGYNSFEGRLLFSVIDAQGASTWSSSQDVSLPFSIIPIPFTINSGINPLVAQPTNYSVKVDLMNNNGELVAFQSVPLTIRGPIFQITQIPGYQTFLPGQEATFTFRAKNTGNQEGACDLTFKAYDLIESIQREWLKPGEEKPLTFSFILPEDLEEKDYFATYELKAQNSEVAGLAKGQIKYHLAGISLNVNASLDKPYYTEGETAHLTLNIQSINPNPQSLFARLNYNRYESQQPFTLSGNQTILFDIPLPRITGEKLFYGVYHESGRSIHLNSLYVHRVGDVLTITTDKQVYKPGDLVSVTVSGNASGSMTLSGPGGYEETFAFTGSVIKLFSLPVAMTAGTYFINAQLVASNPGTITVSHPFDVEGIQVKVLECQNDKGKYASSDVITTNFTIFSNKSMPTLLKTWIVDPEGQYTLVGEQSINLSSSENLLITNNSSLITAASGIHRLTYGIYSGDLLLVSGSEAFDVGDVVLLGISTDKRDYPTNTEPVNATANLFGTVTADLQLELDGNVIQSGSITPNGFFTYQTQLQNITPGSHILKGILTAGGLKSTKETSFTYALAFMPKPQITASPASFDFGTVNVNSTSTKTATLLSKGNVDLVIGMILLSGSQGEFTLANDNCSGKTIVPSGNCSLDIVFLPTSLGTKTASLSIPSNAVNTPTLNLPINGLGVTTLNVSINPGGSGRVTGTGLDCPGDCVETYSTSGATVQLTSTPVEGYQFTNWTGDINQTENPVTVNMNANKRVTANFVTKTYTITATTTLGGTISPSGSVEVSHGGSQTFTIAPSFGYHVADVKVDGASVGAVTLYTLTNVIGIHTIEAIFAINQYTITATAGPKGTITPSGTLLLNYGASQSFTISPDAGYHVADLKVDGISIGVITTFTFDSITSNHTIEVTFAINNSPPVADAGPDQNAATGTLVTLNGKGSFDPEGVVITFLWTFVEVPAGSSVTNGSLSDVTSAKPEFTPDVNGAYKLHLIVNDGESDSVLDEVVINATTPNVAPNANAGPDQYVFTGNPIQLDGSKSNDPDNGPLSLNYFWSFITKPAGSLLTDNAIVNRNLPNAGFTPDVDGLYELMLNINDGNLSSEDTVQIMATTPNVPPNANAGGDITLYLGLTAVLDGSASNDSDNGPQSLGYTWSFVAVPTGSQLTNGAISDANTVSPSFTPDIIGTYVLQLMVFDGRDAGFDNVAVTVVRPQIPPTTSATLSPLPNGSGWNKSNVTVTLDATDTSGAGVKEITYIASGAQSIPSTKVAGSSASLTIWAEGQTTIAFFAIDNMGNIETPKRVIINFDKTAPTISCSASPNLLWPPNHKMVTILVNVNVSDSRSGTAGFRLLSVTSNEPDSGLGDGDTPNDIQGWDIGTADTSGQLRAERSGMGIGRQYTLTYVADDVAGNNATCITTVGVPHDRGKSP